MTYGVTAGDVRLVVGIGTSALSDSQTNSFITDAEAEVDRLLNTAFIPKRQIETQVADNNPSFVMLRRTPVTTVVNIQIGGTAGSWVDPNSTILDNDTGRLWLTGSSGKREFDDDEDRGNVIDYYYAKMEESTTETTLSTRTGTGPGTSVDVASMTGIGTGTYMRIINPIEDRSETVKVLGISSGTFAADVSWDHPTNSRVVKMQVPTVVKELIKVTAGIMASRYMVGATYTFATSYTFPEHTITKGVPYPHFEKVYNSLVKKRDDILRSLRPQSSIY